MRERLRSLIHNWLASGLAVFGSFFLLLWWFKFDDGPLDQEIRNWWQSGGVCSLIAVGGGFLALQLVAEGKLSLGRLSKTGAWLCLLPFLALGSCAGDAYQGAVALGATGESTLQHGVVAAKREGERGGWVRYTDGDGEFETSIEYFLLVASDSGWEEWTLPSGRTAVGYGVEVSEQDYKDHRVGTRIAFVDLPGMGSPRLAKSVVAQVRSGIGGALFWLLVAYAGLWVLRGDLGLQDGSSD